MPGYDHLFGGSGSSSSSSSSSGSSQNNHGTGQSGGGGGGGWSPSNVPDWRKPKDKQTHIVSNPPHQVITDTKAEEEAKEIQHYQNWLGSTAHQGAGAGNVTWKDILKEREEAAYQASKDKQNQMQEAIDLLYSGTQQQGGDWNKDKTITEGLSQFHNLTDAQKQFLIDSGLAAAESSGILGGTMGAELVMNDLKKQLQNATTNEEWQAAAAKLNKLLGQRDEQGNFILDDKGKPISGNTAWMYDDPKYWDDKTKSYMQSIGLYDPTKGSALGYDQSAIYDWSSDIDVTPEGGKSDFLKNAFYNMQSPNLTPSQYTNYMDKISAFGHMGTAPGGTGGGWGSGWGGGYGGGGGSGGSGFGYSTHDPMQQGYQREQVGPGTLQEQVNQIYLGMGNLNAAPGFNKNRGGIVSLVQ